MWRGFEEKVKSFAPGLASRIFLKGVTIANVSTKLARSLGCRALQGRHYREFSRTRAEYRQIFRTGSESFSFFFPSMLYWKNTFCAHKGATIAIFFAPGRRHFASLFHRFWCDFGVRRVPLATPGPPKEQLNHRCGCRVVRKSIFHRFLMVFGVPGGDQNHNFRSKFYIF